MERFYKLIMLLSIVFYTSSDSFARQNQLDSISFSGKVTNSEDIGIHGTVLISYKKSDGIHDRDFYMRTNAIIGKGGYFYFKLPDLQKPYKINVFIRDSLKKTLISKFFYIESGDHVKIGIMQNQSHNEIHFSGNGSEKYNLISQLQDQFVNVYRPRMNLLIKDWLTGSKVIDSSGFTPIMNKVAGVLREFKIAKASLINAVDIHPQIRSIIDYEFGPYDNYWRFLSERLYLTNPTYKKEIGRNYYNHKNEFTKAPDSLAKYCPNYLRSITESMIFELRITNNSDKIQLKSLYDSLKASYSGEVRDRILTRALTFWSIDESTLPYSPLLKDSLLKDALAITTFSYARKALANNIQLIEKTNGVKVNDAVFTGLDGKKKSLKSLRGKVVLIDTWFTGCAGCLQFHQVYEKEIYPKIKDNRNFVLLSLNMNENRSGWLEGIASKKYTSEESLNVWTGNFTDHPFLKYYRMQRGPALMLLDTDGTILYQPIGYKKDELIAKIQYALSKINEGSTK